MVVFGPKPRVNPFVKMSMFGLFESSCFNSLKGAFSFQNSIIDIFLAYVAPPPQKVGIMAVFGPKPWVNRFGKISIFRLFKVLVFIA